MSNIMKSHTSFAHQADRTIPLAFQDVIRDGGEALVAAGLDYTVDPQPLSNVSDAPYADKFWAGVRSTDGAILGVNSKRFHQFQPHDLAVLGDAIIKIRPDAYYSAGGSSKDERTQFLVVTLNDEPVDTADGKYNRNILLANGTNGNCMLTGTGFNFRFFCMNQFRMLHSSGDQLFKLGHTWSAAKAFPTAIQALQDATRQFDEMDRQIEILLNTPLLSSPMKMLSDSVGERPEKAGRAQTHFDTRFEQIVSEYTAGHNAGAFGTAWGLIMAAQAVDEHASKCKAGGRDVQRTMRVLANNYPMTERALALVG